MIVHTGMTTITIDPSTVSTTTTVVAPSIDPSTTQQLTPMDTATPPHSRKFYLVSISEHKEQFKTLLQDEHIACEEILLDGFIVDPKNEVEMGHSLHILHSAIASLPCDAILIMGLDQRMVYEVEVRLACFSTLSCQVICVVFGTDDSVIQWVHKKDNLDTLSTVMNGLKAPLVPLLMIQPGTKLFEAYKVEIDETRQKLLQTLATYVSYVHGNQVGDKRLIEKNVLLRGATIMGKVSPQAKTWMKHLVQKNGYEWTKLFQKEVQQVPQPQQQQQLTTNILDGWEVLYYY